MSTSTLSRPAAAVGFDVFCGIDVARETHHVVALDAGGRRLVDRPLPNGEPELVTLFAKLEAHGRVLVVVDQLASIGALAVAVARSRGVTVGYLPGLSMRRIKQSHHVRQCGCLRQPSHPRDRPGNATPTRRHDARLPLTRTRSMQGGNRDGRSCSLP